MCAVDPIPVPVYRLEQHRLKLAPHPLMGAHSISEQKFMAPHRRS